jgi:hypothetical protein
VIAYKDGKKVSVVEQSGAGRRQQIVQAIWEWENREVMRPNAADSVVIAYDEPDVSLDYERQRNFMSVIRHCPREWCMWRREASGLGELGVGFDGVAEVVPQFAGAVVAHVGDQQELGSGDELGGAAAAAWVDEGVVQAVDHQGRDGQGLQRVGPGAGQEHGA